LAVPLSTAKAEQPKRPGQQAEKLDLESIKRDLGSHQESRVIGALDQAQSSPAQAKELVAEIEKLLAKGTTLKITLSAIRTLSAVGDPRSSRVIAPYVRHRTQSVRQNAATALLSTKGPDAVVALRAALRASDPGVRDIAARGLGGLGAKDALPDLFEALDHRVFAAAVSIGKLCAPAECLKFMDRLGKLQLEVLTSGTNEILFRPDSEVDEKTKLEIIGRIAALHTRPATEYLIDVYKRLPKKGGSKSLKKALGDAVEDNGGDLGEDE
jgi:HEAT repeat protein